MNNTNNTNTTNINSMMTEAAIKEKYLKWNNLKLQLAKLATIMMMIIALLLSRSGFNFPEKNPSKTVYDNDKMLSVDDTIKKIEARNTAIYELTGNKEAKIIVVVENGKSSYKDLQKKADKLFGNYKAGDNGMLFVVSLPNDKSSGFGEAIEEFFQDLFGGGTQPYAYHTGRNLGDISDSKIDGIFKNNFITNYEAGKYNAAVLDTFNALADYFDEYYHIDSKSHAVSLVADSSSATSQSNIATIGGVLILFGVLFIILGIFTKKANPGASKVYKKPFWFGLL